MRRYALGLFVALATGVTQFSLALGDDGPAGLIVLAYLLTVPGLAVTANMGPMGVEARVSVAIGASLVISTVVSGGLLMANLWSPDISFQIIAWFTIVAAWAGTMASARSESRTSPITQWGSA